MDYKFGVFNEIGQLRSLMVHTPDNGIGRITPSMKDELLYDDIVYLDEMRREYYQYLGILLWFLDPKTAKNIPWGEAEKLKNFFDPQHSSYHNSSLVLDVQYLLAEILQDTHVKTLLVASVCAIEYCEFATQNKLLALDPISLAAVLISGILENEGKEEYIFSPVPNLIFTRDIGVMIGDYFLLSKPFEEARTREALLTKYIAYFHLFKDSLKSESGEIIELKELEMFNLSLDELSNQAEVSIEGGDVMMVAPRHLVVGLSQRTSASAIDRLTNVLFQKNIVDRVSVVHIPAKRAYMHIDTVFTMVRKDLWVCFHPLSKQMRNRMDKRYNYLSDLQEENYQSDQYVSVTQFTRIANGDQFDVKSKQMDDLEDLFLFISKEHYNSEAEVLYCGDGLFPHNEREQWTDACNYLCLSEGIIIGFDRNVETIKTFKNNGFRIVYSQDLIAEFEKGLTLKELENQNILILLPSGELSRARGGTHCMSMPLLRNL